MCGITGIVDFKNNSMIHTEKLDKMLSVTKHRGPDETGTLFYDNCALGHNRLSIVDISTGQQPMQSSLTGDLAITFNGEIYGYQDIRKKIADYKFRTASDTELILALYLKHGEDSLDRLPGIFSFALWDDRKKELFCARDRFGEKPFYYSFGQNGEFVFASEIKSIIASGLVIPEIDEVSMMHYLKRLYVHPYKTIYSNIFVLPPAHKLIVSKENLRISKYWEMPAVNVNIKISDAFDNFRFLLETAVKKQLVADVEVGAFLSGGLDSSTIVALASKQNRQLKTIAFGFQNNKSELPYARAIAEKYETDHIELHDADFNIAEMLFEMQRIYDEPFADSSNIPMYIICREAKKYLNVVLTGDGGDELLGGYSYWYRPLLERKRNSMSHNLFTDSLRIFRKLINRNKVLQSVSMLHHEQNTYFTDHDLKSIMIKKNTLSAEQPDLIRYNYNTVDDAMRMDIDNYMPGDILVKTDRASMANSLELRSPFLDIDFASFCLTLPYSLKINDRYDKLIMREVFDKMWTEEIKNRPKQGFGAPVDKWLKLRDVFALKERYLKHRSMKIYNYINFEKTEPMRNEDSYRTWILLNLSLWIETR